MEISKCAFYRQQQVQYCDYGVFFQKQIYYQFSTKRVPGCLAWKKSRALGDGNTMKFLQTLHQPNPFSCAAFEQCIFPRRYLFCLLEQILNTCQLKNVGTMSTTLTTCFPCPTDSQESVSTQIKPCKGPYTTAKTHLAFFPLQPALKSNDFNIFIYHLSETKQKSNRSIWITIQSHQKVQSSSCQYSSE